MPRKEDKGSAKATMKSFRFLWAFDAIVAAVVMFFFFWGLADGTVSSFNMGLWVTILAVVAGIVGGSLVLERNGHRGAAIGLLCLLALPGFAFVLFFGAVMILQPRWN